MDTYWRHGRNVYAYQAIVRVRTKFFGEQMEQALVHSWLLSHVSAIESKTHGNVLWAPLDHGATRIGYAFTPQIADKYHGQVTEEIAVQEAIAAVSPFDLKFTQVHWWTLYVFQVPNQTLLTGGLTLG